MQQLITTLHLLISVLLVIMVLIQRGKGSEMGAGFGSGASGTMFGSQGATPFLVKLTAGLALLFFLSSAVLSFVVGKHAVSQRETLPFVIAAPMKTLQDIPVSPEVQQETPAPVAPSIEGNSTHPQERVSQKKGT